jgi:hypothetical protein
MIFKTVFKIKRKLYIASRSTPHPTPNKNYGFGPSNLPSRIADHANGGPGHKQQLQNHYMYGTPKRTEPADTVSVAYQNVKTGRHE